MKIAKFFAVIFAVLGIVLMLGSAVICFASMNAGVKVIKTPDAAIACADQFVHTLDSGDLAGAAKLMYGQPELDVEGTPADAVGAALWENYKQDLACAASGKLHLNGSDFVRNVTITVLDVSSITGSVQARAKILLEQQVAAATDMNQLYDAENNFRKELVDQVMQQALEQAIREDAKYTTQEASFRVISRDGKWWVVPDQALLNLLSGSGA